MHHWTEPAFAGEEEAYRFVEARVWPEGPVCAHCGRGDRVGRLGGSNPRPGAYKCYACRKPFNVKLGTMLEATHVPLHLWLQALYLLHACDPPVSVNRLHRILGVSSRTTWLMSQRFRDRLSQSAPPAPDWVDGDKEDSDEGVVLSHNWDELRRALWDYVSIVRTTKRLQRARTRVQNLAKEINEYYWNFKVEPGLLELRNLIENAALIVGCALQRHESRGLHFTLDYPEKSPTPEDSRVEGSTGALSTG